jgi:hypothetical protein
LTQIASSRICECAADKKRLRDPKNGRAILGVGGNDVDGANDILHAEHPIPPCFGVGRPSGYEPEGHFRTASMA